MDGRASQSMGLDLGHYCTGVQRIPNFLFIFFPNRFILPQKTSECFQDLNAAPKDF